jgi:hypothetical protein
MSKIHLVSPTVGALFNELACEKEKEKGRIQFGNNGDMRKI